MKSKRYYEYSESHVRGETTDVSFGFHKIPSYLDNTNNTVGDELSQDETRQTKDTDASDRYITPMEFYSSKLSTNSNMDVSNGMVTKEDAASKFSSQYWWCEDLHNWCIYDVDCISDPYGNYFYLKVWNGRNGWESVGMHEYENKEVYLGVIDSKDLQISPFQDWRKQQNNIMYDMYKSNHVITQHRGTGSFHNFGVGPLNVVNAFVLNKNEKYSVNSQDKFQTIRWSTPKHIIDDTEFDSADSILRSYTFVTNGRRVLIKFRETFITNNNGNIFEEKDHPFMQLHSFNAVNSSTKNSTTYKDYKIGWKFDKDKESAGYTSSDGKFVKKSYSHSNRTWDEALYYVDNLYDNYYDCVVDGKCDRGITHRKLKYNDENVVCMPATPLTIRMGNGNYWCFSQMAQEKIFAVYFFDDNDATANFKCGPKNWYISNDRVYQSDDEKTDDNPWVDCEKECMEINGQKILPIFMSYIDLEYVFHSFGIVDAPEYPNYYSPSDVKTAWNGQGSASVYSTVPDCKNLWYETWRKTNKYMLQRLTYMLYPDKCETFNSNNEQFNRIYSSHTSTRCNMSEPLNIFYKASDSSYRFYRLWSISDCFYSTSTAALVNAIDPGGLSSFLGIHEKNVVRLPYYSIHKYSINGDYKITTSEVITGGNTSTVNTALDDDAPFKADAQTIITGIFDNTVTISYKNYTTTSLTYTKNKNYYVVTKFTTPTVSNFREGISIGNPAIWRLPTGEVALCAVLMWGGQNRLIGGPGNEDNIVAANKWCNEIAISYFGRGTDRTIEKHWLKENFDIVEKSETGLSNKINIISKSELESGKVFEQINKIDDNAMSLTISTYRPNIYTDGTSGNIDLAKKW